MASPNTDLSTIPDAVKKEVGLTATGNTPAQMHSQLDEKINAAFAVKEAVEKMNAGEALTQAEARNAESLEHKALGYRPPSGSIPAQAKSYATKQERLSESTVVEAASEQNTTEDTASSGVTKVCFDEITPKISDATKEATLKKTTSNEGGQNEGGQNAGYADRNVSSNQEMSDQCKSTPQNHAESKDDKENAEPVNQSGTLPGKLLQLAKSIIQPELDKEQGTVTDKDTSMLPSIEGKASGIDAKPNGGKTDAEIQSPVAKDEVTAGQDNSTSD